MGARTMSGSRRVRPLSAYICMVIVVSWASGVSSIPESEFAAFRPVPEEGVSMRRLAQYAAGAASAPQYYNNSVGDGPPCDFGLPPARLTPTSPGVADALAAAEAAAQAAMSKYALPGVGLTVVQGDATGGGALLSKGYGVANPATGAKVTADSAMRIGSISKIFVSLALVQLAEDGVVSLSDRLSMYIPELMLRDPFGADPSTPIVPRSTLIELVTFSGGVPREGCVAIPGSAQPGCGLLIGSNFSAIVDAMKGASLILPSNSRTPVYSNFAFALVGLALDRAISNDSSVPYDSLRDFVKGRVSKPLGLSTTGFTITPDVEKKFALNANTTANDATRFLDTGFTMPCGGMFSTASDLGRLTSFLASSFDATQAQAHANVVEADALRAYIRPYTILPEGSAAFGMGWALVWLPEGYWAVTKGGAYIAYSSSIAFIPELGIGASVVGSANFDGSAVTIPALRAMIAPAKAAAKAVAVAQWVGTYSYAGVLTANVTISDSGALNVRFNQPATTFALLATGMPGRFFLTQSGDGCLIDEQLVSASMGGPHAVSLDPADLIVFEGGSSGGPATNLSIPSKGVALTRQ